MTTQMPDYLTYNGEEHYVNGGISPLGGIQENKQPKFPKICSACWRGYIAEWIINEQGWLQVSEINLYQPSFDSNEEQKNIIYELYSGHDSPVTATWVSGEVEVALGEVVGECGQYINIFERYRIFNVKAGKVLGVQEFDSEWWSKKHNCLEKNERIYKII